MDGDQAQLGNGGKAQKPHDHNRAWTDTPIYAFVRAVQAELHALDQQKRLIGARIASGPLEIPVGPPRNFPQPAPAQHIILGAGLGQSMLRWLEDGPTRKP